MGSTKKITAQQAYEEGRFHALDEIIEIIKQQSKTVYADGNIAFKVDLLQLIKHIEEKFDKRKS